MLKKKADTPAVAGTISPKLTKSYQIYQYLITPTKSRIKNNVGFQDK